MVEKRTIDVCVCVRDDYQWVECAKGKEGGREEGSE
jgi:hypothetical protein